MLAPDLVVAAGVVAVLLTKPLRTLIALVAGVLLLWLHLWWLLPLLGPSPPGGLLWQILSLPRATWILSSGTSSPSPWWPWRPACCRHRPEARETSLSGPPAEVTTWLPASSGSRTDGSGERSARSSRHGPGAGLQTSPGPWETSLAPPALRAGGGTVPGHRSLAPEQAQGNDAEARALWLRWGSTLVESRHPELAIEPFLRAGDSRRAALATELALAGQRLSSGHVDTALRAAREAKRPALGAQAALIGERFREAGDLFLVANEPLAAAHAFSRAGDSLRAAEALRLAGRTEEAAHLRAPEVAHLQRAVRQGAVGLRGRRPRRAGGRHPAVRMGRHEEAVSRYLEAGLKREAAELARTTRSRAGGSPVRGAG